MDRPRGHGLGLTLASRIVEAHEGTLELSAKPAGGLTATVCLPLAGTSPLELPRSTAGAALRD